MQLTNTPGKLVLPFANTGAKNTIPTASQIGITAGAASLTDGFPPLTRTPIAAGGVPPSGLDMNGILYELSAILRWANAGGGYAYDAAFATDSNVGGYPKGARIMRSDGLGYWFNTVENNTTDPEAAGAAAAGWVPDFTNGVTSVAMASANVTLTPLQYGKPIIVITGTLTANLNLIFPTIVNEWTVINNTTGPYTITCKTAAGTGIVVNTAALIVGDGTNIQSAVTDAAALFGETVATATGGTADAITATFTPVPRYASNGVPLSVRATAANGTTTPTFTPNSGVIAAKTIVKGAGAALAAGDIAGGGHWIELQYDATLDKWVLLNPATGVTGGVRTNQNNTFTKAQRGALVTLTDAATITPDFSLSNNYQVVLGGNRTLAVPTNLVAGQSGVIDIFQDATGSRTLALAWGWSPPGGTAPALSTAALTRDQWVYYVGTAAQSVVNISIATPGVVTWNGHGLKGGEKIQFTTTGALPTGLTASTTYYVKPVDANTFQLSATLGGAAIATSGSQSGVHTAQAVSITINQLKAVSGSFAFNYTISSDTANFNLRTAAVGAGWDGIAPINAVVTVNPGVYVYSSSTTSPAFDTGTPFPSGSTLNLVNNGFIVGRGGNGASIGAIGYVSAPSGTAGGDGGPALKAQFPITVSNIGTIGGGGGGGGSGGSAYHNSGGSYGMGGGGGGGGQGYADSTGGAGGSPSGNQWNGAGASGISGTKSSAGNGGSGNGGAGVGSGGNGGAGGALGQTGSAGGAGSAVASPPYGGAGSGGPGGAPGHAVTGNANINWSLTGTRAGPIA